MMNQVENFDVTTLIKGDVIHYYAHENGKFFIEQGNVKEDNIYSDGVEVHGDGWKQYVSKYFICKVLRNDKIIFAKDEE